MPGENANAKLQAYNVTGLIRPNCLIKLSSKKIEIDPPNIPI